MAGLNKVEEYLLDLGISYEEPQPGTWVVDDPAKGLPELYISYADPVVIVHARIMPVPAEGREAFYAELLKLNYDGLLHGAYALEGEQVVLLDSLEYETMDKPEFEASLDAIGLAVAEHGARLSRYKTN
ncbi:MAG TPA: hypothetical protein PLB91_01010 [Spirochaetales bacterium]|nr:hypothetical protein [Spirochaetales bacterium]HRZ65187.1 hypothetical protein [Spirochaetia bacterium]